MSPDDERGLVPLDAEQKCAAEALIHSLLLQAAVTYPQVRDRRPWRTWPIGPHAGCRRRRGGC
jgi:hypothetical protein